jgi:Flp pilus assembly protein TadD
LKAADTEVHLALSLDPTSLEVRVEQGLLAFRKGLNAGAAKVLRGVCKQDPRHAAAHFYLGEALNRLGRVAEAVAAMERVIELQPDNWRAYHTLGMLFDKMYEPERATEMHRRVRELTCVDSARG